MPVIELYHCAGARSFRPLWTLEELSLPYRLHALPFPPRERSPDYLAENPLGTVPLLVDGETRITESAAACHYLATRDGPTPLAIEPGEPDYGAYLNWLHLGEATLTFPQTIVLRYTHLEPPERRQPQVADDYGRWYSNRLKAVERALQSRTWLAADRFTAADVSVGSALSLADQIGLGRRSPPRAADYCDRLRRRDGFRRAEEAERRAAMEAGIPIEPLVPGA